MKKAEELAKLEYPYLIYDSYYLIYDSYEKEGINNIKRDAFVNGYKQAMQEYASQSKQGWVIGKMVEVTKCIHGHEFEIGDTVIIVDYENTCAPDKWLCEKGIDRWYLSEEEGELIHKPLPAPPTQDKEPDIVDKGNEKLTPGLLEKNGWKNINVNYYSKGEFDLWYHGYWVLQLRPKSANEIPYRILENIQNLSEVNNAISSYKNPEPDIVEDEQLKKEMAMWISQMHMNVNPVDLQDDVENYLNQFTIKRK